MNTALEKTAPPPGVSAELGPFYRAIAARYFEPVRFSEEATAALARLHRDGFVVHVMRSTSWVNYLYITWAMVRRNLPPVRAVFNLRRWFTKPWRMTAQRGPLDVRFTYAKRHHGSGLVFLRRSGFGTIRGRNVKEDPFPALVALARKADRPVYLVPELFVWERIPQRLQPSVLDYVLGSPEAPGFLHSVLSFLRNFRRAQFRVGDPIDLRAFIADNPADSDELIARKVRGALHHHLAQETRAVFGPPAKHPDRLMEEALRDRVLRRSLEEHAVDTKRRMDSVFRHALRDLRQIAARPSTTVTALIAPVLDAVFTRIYDGMEVDEAGLERAMKAAARAPIVLCPSHKSHIDYLVMSWVLWNRGYSVPLVAAGANLSFFPLGWILRRAGAFFLRRSFKDDKVYTAAFRAYIKKLVHDGVHHEFFPEGGRSRSGKLLPPKLGVLTWQVDAVLEGASKDLVFVPAAIDYERVVESGSYSKELAGGEKPKEDLKALLSAPKVLAHNYGRIHLTFDEPVSLAELMRARGVNLGEPVSDDQKKSLVRALGHRIMYGISRVSTITPHALVAAALLAHRRRGITAPEVSDRIQLLRRIAEEQRAPLSKTLKDSPSDPTVLGAVHDAIETLRADKMVVVDGAKGETIYRTVDERRGELSFSKNTLINLMAPMSMVATAVLSGATTRAVVHERALFLSRLFKFEFIYRVGVGFEQILGETVEKLVGLGLLRQGPEDSVIPSDAPETKDRLSFLADLLRDFLESYLLAALAVKEVAASGGMDRKVFVKVALETGRAEFLSGRIGAAEALSRTNLENAQAYLLDQQGLIDENKRFKVGPSLATPEAREALILRIRELLRE